MTPQQQSDEEEAECPGEQGLGSGLRNITNSAVIRMPNNKKLFIIKKEMIPKLHPRVLNELTSLSPDRMDQVMNLIALFDCYRREKRRRGGLRRKEILLLEYWTLGHGIGVFRIRVCRETRESKRLRKK